LILLINHYAANHIRPIMAEMARVRVNRLASQVINQAITEKISGISYNDLVVFEKDIYGQITALKTDTVTVNRFRSEIAAAVLNALEKADTSGIAIPVGNLINGDLFGGRGPRIPLKIVPLGTVSAQLGNQFSDAGINQTRHQIMMDVAVSITVLLPGYNVDTEVTAQVSVAETVIVGEVPDSYWTGTLPPAA
jgi:sporulation protein YunB